MPWRIQFHTVLRKHLLVRYNSGITVGLGDSARGIYARCECGKEWAL